MTVAAKVFASGRSQALRLPAGSPVQIHQRYPSSRLVMICGWSKLQVGNDMGRWFGFLRDQRAFTQSFLADRQDTPAQEHDWT